MLGFGASYIRDLKVLFYVLVNWINSGSNNGLLRVHFCGRINSGSNNGLLHVHFCGRINSGSNNGLLRVHFCGRINSGSNNGLLRVHFCGRINSGSNKGLLRVHFCGRLSSDGQYRLKASPGPYRTTFNRNSIKYPQLMFPSREIYLKMACSVSAILVQRGVVERRTW